MKDLGERKLFDIKVGWGCNFSCLHCVMGYKLGTGNLTTEEIKHAIDMAPDNVTYQITGGEPSIRKDLPEILEYAAKKHPISLLTNATGFADPDFAKACGKYITDAVVTFHSVDEDIYNLVANGHGDQHDKMYQKGVAGLKNLVANGVYVRTQTIINKYSMSTLYDTYAFLQSIAPGAEMAMTYAHANGNAWKNRDQVFMTYDELRQYVIPCLRDFGPQIAVQDVVSCHIHPYNYNAPFADFTHHELTFKGGIIGVDLTYKDKVLDYGPALDKGHIRPEKCNGCIYYDGCYGVWREHLKIIGDIDLKPIKNREATYELLEPEQIIEFHDKLNKGDKLPDLNTSLLILKGKVCENAEIIKEKYSDKNSFCVNAADINEKDFGVFEDYPHYLLVEDPKTDISKYYNIKSRNWHIDIVCRDFTEESMIEFLNTLEKLQGIKFIRMIPSPYFMDTFEEAKLIGIIAKIFKIFDEKYIMSMVNMPWCRTFRVPTLFRNKIITYRIYKNDMKVVTEKCKLEQKDSSCKECEYGSTCMGYQKSYFEEA